FEETGMGFALEVDMIAQAHGLDLLTTPYVFNTEEAAAMARAGADIIVAHMGVTTGGAIGAKGSKSLAQCADEVAAISAAARAVRGDIIVLCHGGPIAMPADAKFILDRVRTCHGFYGASSMERLPVELAISAQVEAFRALKTGETIG
ncbi:MAG: phosphoenolpyruvate hydrolase family protein, partial [Devosia sp.]|nr:phosphoenolpyruvate hydrolase family protein [Devosia sp.]